MAAATFRLLNCQRRDAVPLAWLGRLARCAARSLKIAGRGEFIIVFVDGATMRRLHGRFLRQRTMTDVLTFRYQDPPERRLSEPSGVPEPEGFRPKRKRSEPSGVPEPEGFRPVVGELVITPAAARTYATRHGISYRQELARYVVHGLLHWLGYDDQTPMQQRAMRKREDQLLACCGR